MNLVNGDGVLADKLERQNRPDNIHLGNLGMRELVKSLKSTLISKKSYMKNSPSIPNPTTNQPWPLPSWMLGHPPTQTPAPPPFSPPFTPSRPFAAWPPQDCIAINPLGLAYDAISPLPQGRVYCWATYSTKNGGFTTYCDGHHDGWVVGWGGQFPLSANALSGWVFLNNLH